MSDTRLTPDRIAVLRALEADATPRPWVADTADTGTGVWHGGSGGTICEINFDHQTGDHRPGGDQTLIAAMRNELLALLDEVEALERELISLRLFHRQRLAELEAVTDDELRAALPAIIERVATNGAVLP